ncbi:MAG: type II/IV secretion system ATPase subunit [Candidatus Micrarchaeota archaeon]
MVDFEQAIKKYPHLRLYLAEFKKKGIRTPRFYEKVPKEIGDEPSVSIIYPTVEEKVFIHVLKDMKNKRYFVVEPKLNSAETKKYHEILTIILENAPREKVPENDKDLEKTLMKLFDMSVRKSALSIIEFGARKVFVSDEEYEKFVYYVRRDIIGQALLQPILGDPYIEDIHEVGARNIRIIHKIFDAMETDLTFDSEQILRDFLRNLSERIGRPVSIAKPIADSVLPDGSRVNIIYAEDVSLRGCSFTIRKFSTIPTSIIQLIKYGSINPDIAAYLWLCLENGMNVFVAGETASGKTTILNALLVFVHPDAKILTAEDTPEVRPPHPLWQQLLTRESGPEEGRVDMFVILKAALRSRPNYIIVGEIRGKEGLVAFQAMQTGHSVMATFHASSIKRMIQRLAGDPINVPVTFMDNLNVAIFLQAVYVRGKFLRRCTAVEEVEGYSEDAGGVVTRQMFSWDPGNDIHKFGGLNNSYVLEDKIAPKAGYLDPRKIYDELAVRTRIVEIMVEKNMTDYFQVNDAIIAFYRGGITALPFRV